MREFLPKDCEGFRSLRQVGADELHKGVVFARGGEQLLGFSLNTKMKTLRVPPLPKGYFSLNTVADICPAVQHIINCVLVLEDTRP